MVCPACGSPVPAGVRFCARCGAQISAAEPAPNAYATQPPIIGHYPPGVGPAIENALRATRVQRNLQTLGILWFVFGAYRILGGLLGIIAIKAIFGHSFGGDWPFGDSFGHGGPSWLLALVPVIAVFTVISTILAFLVGYALLNRKPWGRTLAIVAAILALLKPILGTALGVYTLWMLAPATAAIEYESLADRT
jgi:hypothetical protein